MPPKPTKGGIDPSKCCPSAFTLTFVVEVVGIDVFHDCNEGLLDLSPGPAQGVKLQYQLAPGQNYSIDVVIWPHTAKVWCGSNSAWVRTWFFLQRRWLAFSISHVFPVRVDEFRMHIATVTPAYGIGNIGANVKCDKTEEVYLPKLGFGERRQFATVIEGETNLLSFIMDLIWSLIERYIPASYMDGPFDEPHLVNDKRHQDAVIEHVQNIILNRPIVAPEQDELTMPSRNDMKGKPKKVVEVIKYEISLTGDKIICGTGRIIPFNTVGDKPQDNGDIIVLIATAGLPAADDLPVIFINVGQLTDIPVDELLKRNISEIYTKWTIDEEEHQSEPQRVQKQKQTVDFDDHHAVPLPLDTGSEIISRFLDSDYRIELRGIRTLPETNLQPSLFGYEKGDRDYPSLTPPKLPNLNTDILIGTTKIDARQMVNKSNSFLRGDYPIYPLNVTIKELERDEICTNDLNGVRAPLIPEIIVPTGVILKAQMLLEVSMGLIGCKLRRRTTRYSRLYDLVEDTEAIMGVLNHIASINEQVMENGERSDLLSGFALDTGDAVLLYVEGPRDGQILRVWEMTADYFPDMKPIFSSSVKYRTRLYPEFPKGAVPFVIMKMFVPLSVLLACPPIYARPAMPVLTRHAVLKLGRLLSNKKLEMPDVTEMPTTAELRSFRLELCVAPRPPPPIRPAVDNSDDNQLNTKNGPTGGQKINFETSVIKKV